jgi:hypothetical protein
MNAPAPSSDRLYAELEKALEKAHHACFWLMQDELYEVVVQTAHTLYRKPTECDLASVEIRRGGNEILITYDASFVCADEDEEEDGEEARGGDEEQCLREAEELATLTLNEYRKLISKWAEELGVSYVEELKRDGLTFTLRITPS